MEIADYLRVLKRSWLLIVIATIAGGFGGYWVYGSKTPMYRSSVHLVLPGSDLGFGNVPGNALSGNDRAVAASQIVGTVPAVNAAKKAAGFPHAAVSATGIASSGPYLTISVVGPSPTEAQTIANEFVYTLPITIAQLGGPRALDIRSLAPASLPRTPFSPHLRREVGLGVVAGLVLGLLIAVLREAFDRTVRDSADVDEVTDLPILGTVPRDLPKKRLPAVSNPRSARAEAYRQVRATLINVRHHHVRTMAVTSASVGEGKTSVATNLAAAFSRAGHRVAVVDADLRRPAVATFFGLESQRGLTDVLAGTCSLHEALNLLDDGRLAILASGLVPANPSEALGGAAMEHTLQQLADEYDYVIVDTPPVLPVSDPMVVAPLVDGVILVLQLGRTTHDQVRRAKRALDSVNADVIGVVPNQSGMGRDRYYRYPYRYAYARRRKEQEPAVNLPVSVDGQPRSRVPATAHPDPVAPTGNGRRRVAGTDPSRGDRSVVDER